MLVMPTNQEVTFPDGQIIVSKTDLKGKITYGNEIFIRLSGYSEGELLNKPHSIVRHPDMPALIFKKLWEELQAGKEIHAYVKNLAKNGAYYWVKANVTPSRDVRGNVVGYYSVRRKPTRDAIGKVEKMYTQLKSLEATGGKAAENYLNELLKEKGVTYEEFILSL